MSDDKIKKLESITPTGTHFNPDAQKKEPRQEQEGHGGEKRDKVKDHYSEISVMIERANGKLRVKSAPYRFGLRREGEDIIIDIIRINEKGETISVSQRNITHENVNEVVKHIVEREGILFDSER